MTYGPHSDLVQEIVDFAERGPVLQPAAPIQGERLHVIGDFAEAQEYAYRRYITDDEDADNWTDLRQKEASKILAARYKDPSLAPVFQAVRELLKPLTQSLARLPAPYTEIVDDVAADLRNCAQSRAVFGANTNFFDLLWNAYQQGGWPCGWEGPYPGGRLVVYQPPIPK
jgi:hypothetical protein